ncbi:Crp/Fnr family transcriptional regulator [Candidatus Gottesmanbacteria bacterium]|nr:Crp/Fnr family transcriptional regulator [Candidatus Gottesmanbacteria bacterium]
MILRSGDTPSGVYLVRRGFVRNYSMTLDGKELTLVIYSRDDFFPVMWAIHKMVVVYNFEAMTAAEIWCAPRGAFLTFINQNPDVMSDFLSSVSFRFAGILERLTHMTYGNALTKVASLISILTMRFGVKKGKSIVIGMPLTHHEIASLVGMARETVSIEMEKLIKMGALEVKHKTITVKKARILRKLAEY